MLNILDRTLQPPIQIAPKLFIPEAQKLTWANGTDVWMVESNSVPVLRIEFLIPKNGIKSHLGIGAAFTLLQEGSTKYNSSEIAKWFDSFGAHFQVDNGVDYITIAFFTLEKYLPEIMPLVESILLEPTFPETELEIEKAQMTQNLRYNQEKVAYLARKSFYKAIFDQEHPYFPINSEENINSLKQSDLIEAYKNLMFVEGTRIFIAGFGCLKAATLLEQAFGKLHLKPRPKKSDLILNTTNIPIRIQKDNAVQTAIRMGCLTIGRNHPDYIDLKIANTVLGGYFGSRLMQSIRETKGYTYGIGSSVQSQQFAAWFTLATEVRGEVTNDAVDTIISDLTALIAEPIPTQELKNMQLYLEGNILASFDGAFAIGDRYKDVLLDNGSIAYYNQFLSRLKEVSPVEIQAICAKYLHPDKLTTVLVGNFA